MLMGFVMLKIYLLLDLWPVDIVVDADVEYGGFY